MIKNVFIIGNWKLNGDKNLINIFYEKLNNLILKNKNIKIILSPPIIYLDYACKIFNKNKNIFICSQNVDINYQGSFTGEISTYMLKEIGVSYVIIGHSERRNLHKESNEKILKKFINVKSNNMIPILCIGENKEDFLNKKSLQKCLNQIKPIIKYGNIDILYGSIIAYEPIWSIGTNINANLHHIKYINNSILNYLYKFDKNIKNKINIIYGGSVSSSNLNELYCKKNIDGFLIGKSSLDIDEFLNIINILKNK